MKNTTLEGWRRELAATNLEAVKRPVPVEQWVTAAGMPALDALLCSVAYGSTLKIEPCQLLGGGSGWLASLESQTGARFAAAEADNLGTAIIELAAHWKGK